MTLEKVEFDRHPVSDPPTEGDLFEVQEAVARWADNYGQHPRIGLSKPGVQSVPTGTATALTWGEQPDHVAGMKVHSDSHVEIPIDGLYTITVHIGVSSFTSSGKYLHVDLYENGDIIKSLGSNYSSGSSGVVRVGGSVDVELKKGNTVSAVVTHDYGSNRDIGGDANRTYFQVRGVW